MTLKFHLALFFVKAIFAFQIYQLEHGAKLAETSGVLTAESSKKWLDDQHSKNENHQFFASLTGFAVCGTKR